MFESLLTKQTSRKSSQKFAKSQSDFYQQKKRSMSVGSQKNAAKLVGHPATDAAKVENDAEKLIK